MTLTIGDVVRRTGLTERTLRFYEEQGLLAPARDAGGRRRYDSATLDRLYRVRLLRELGVPVADVDPDAADLLTLARRHLADLDEQAATRARLRERVRAVEDRLLGGSGPTDEALLDLLAGLADDELTPTRRVTLLVYRDLAAAHRFLVDVFGLRPGPLSCDADGAPVHGEVGAGDGVVWLHRESASARLASPATLGAATACLAVDVDDVHAHHDRVVAAGAEVEGPPEPRDYGVLEYSARDVEGHLWSFHEQMPDADTEPDTEEEA